MPKYTKINLQISPTREAKYRQAFTRFYNMPSNASWSRIIPRILREHFYIIQQLKEKQP